MDHVGEDGREWTACNARPYQNKAGEMVTIIDYVTRCAQVGCPAFCVVTVSTRSDLSKSKVFQNKHCAAHKATMSGRNKAEFRMALDEALRLIAQEKMSIPKAALAAGVGQSTIWRALAKQRSE